MPDFRVDFFTPQNAAWIFVGAQWPVSLHLGPLPTVGEGQQQSLLRRPDGISSEPASKELIVSLEFPTKTPTFVSFVNEQLVKQSNIKSEERRSYNKQHLKVRLHLPFKQILLCHFAPFQNQKQPTECDATYAIPDNWQFVKISDIIHMHFL